MSDVPEDLWPEILKRLPVESLISLRSVCKSWCQTIDDPVFVKMKMQHHLQVDGGDHLIIYEPTIGFGNLYSLPLSSLNHSGESTKSVEPIRLKNLMRPGFSHILGMPVPSCHGLILTCHIDPKYSWAVVNPFMNTYLDLPDCNHLSYAKPSAFQPYDVTMDEAYKVARDQRENRHNWGISECSAGIGYDVSTDDYKVVRVEQLHNHHLNTLIYSLKSKTWRRIEDYPHYVDIFHREYGGFFNGALHWFTRMKEEGGDGDEVGRVLALDLADEKYHQIPVPEPTFAPQCPLDIHVEAVSGSLFITYFSYGDFDTFDVWMLNDEQGENIWDLLVSLKVPGKFGNRLEYPRLISYSKSKQQVVIQNQLEILWFDVEKKCGTKVSVLGLDGIFSCQAFPVSLFRFNGSTTMTHDETFPLKGSLKRKRMTSTPNGRLSLTLNSSDFTASSDGEEG